LNDHPAQLRHAQNSQFLDQPEYSKNNDVFETKVRALKAIQNGICGEMDHQK